MANNQARTCELKCKYNVQGICHAYGECIAKDLFIAELEKIKAEIAKKYALNFDFSWSTVCSILDDLNNHIKELKGENNVL